MLVLTRKVNEKVYIGDDIILTIVGKQGNKIMLGFEAPIDVRIVRDNCKKISRLESE